MTPSGRPPVGVEIAYACVTGLCLILIWATAALLLIFESASIGGKETSVSAG